MNDSFGGGFTQQGGDAKQESKAEGTLPVFIKQIQLQKDDLVKMWGFEYKMITLVAVVRNIDHSSTKITYALEDFSGRINAHLWVEEGDAPTSSGIMLNTYARVIGAVRQQSDVKSIMIFKIQPAKGINEVSTHYLEVINARYQAEEYFRGGTGSGEAGFKMDVDHHGDKKFSADAQSEPTGKDLVVFNVIKASALTKPDSGISRQELCRKFPHISDAEMSSILQKMAIEGHVYNTFDPDHFLPCF